MVYGSIFAASPADLVLAAPLAFMFGVACGLGAASRWRIVRRRNGWDD